MPTYYTSEDPPGCREVGKRRARSLESASLASGEKKFLPYRQQDVWPSDNFYSARNSRQRLRCSSDRRLLTVRPWPMAVSKLETHRTEGASPGGVEFKSGDLRRTVRRSVHVLPQKGGPSMATRARFLDTRYGAYHHRDVPADEELLTRVGPGTPGGEYLRRFWQPIAQSAALKDLPCRIRILGEDLVLFRDRSGQVGLLELHCSHRGASLEFGVISERGIRCCYHGWLFDVDGRILETPAEPVTSTLRDRLCHGAYPTHEYKGLVFAYMGPPDKKPAFPIYDTYELEGYRLGLSSIQYWDCNWLQIQENAMDPIHSVFLHTRVSGAQFTDAYGELPVLEWVPTPTGMVYIGTRRVGDNVWARLVGAIFPNIHQAPPFLSEDAKQEKTVTWPMTTWWKVPVDDTHTIVLGYLRVPEGATAEAQLREVDAALHASQTENRSYEERQRAPGDYDALTGIRPIAIHALEHPASTDGGVLMWRKLVRDGIRTVKSGLDPIGVSRDSGNVIPTYTRDVIIRKPPAATPEEDRQLLLEAGRTVLASVLPGEPTRSVMTARSTKRVG
jgi:phenylpropionate dioxygenase-like ring-hydroxylating dioxygenase large terminal subunit